VEHPDRNEEDALTAAIELHRSQHGMGDSRTMAKFMLEHLGSHRERKATERAEVVKQAAIKANAGTA
jgi:hypothetical protein